MVFSLIKMRLACGWHAVCFFFVVCFRNDEEAFCRNINSPFFTLMLLWKLKIKNKRARQWCWSTFKGSAFFSIHSTRRVHVHLSRFSFSFDYLSLLYCRWRKVYVCPLFMINIKKGVRKAHKHGRMWKEKSFPFSHSSHSRHQFSSNFSMLLDGGGGGKSGIIAC